MPRSNSRVRSHRPLFRSAHARAPSWIPEWRPRRVRVGGARARPCSPSGGAQSALYSLRTRTPQAAHTVQGAHMRDCAHMPACPRIAMRSGSAKHSGHPPRAPPCAPPRPRPRSMLAFCPRTSPCTGDVRRRARPCPASSRQRRLRPAARCLTLVPAHSAGAARSRCLHARLCTRARALVSRRRVPRLREASGEPGWSKPGSPLRGHVRRV